MSPPREACPGLKTECFSQKTLNFDEKTRKWGCKSEKSGYIKRMSRGFYLVGSDRDARVAELADAYG